MKNKMVTGIIVTAVVFGGIGFYAGRQYAKNQAASGGRQFTQGMGSGFAGRAAANRDGSGVAFGNIISKDATSITIQLTSMGNNTPSGSGAKIVLYNPSTQVGKFVAGTASDLSVGETVTINGTPNSDGSITATMIQVRPSAAEMQQRRQ